MSARHDKEQATITSPLVDNGLHLFDRMDADLNISSGAITHHAPEEQLSPPLPIHITTEEVRESLQRNLG